jgi:ADP-ribosyl-[dinitrogen reductase] hydrolase
MKFSTELTSSLGDTIGAITGSIAEAMFGIPDEIVAKGRSYLSNDINQVVDRFNGRMEIKPD